MNAELGPLRFASPDAGRTPAGRHEEEAPQNGIGIYNESDRLTRAAIWGSAGAESLVAQLYPKRLSLFLATMDVPKARDEAVNFALALSRQGVALTLVRDSYAKTLEPNGHLRRDEVAGTVLGRAESIVDGYRGELEGEIEDASKSPDPNVRRNGRKEVYPSNFEEDLEALLDADSEQYGEQIALELAQRLIIDPQMPMGNLIYARDQMNVLLGTRFQASMARPIRVPEVELYEGIYARMGLPPAVELPPGETFEGGDAYIHNGFVYVGVGTRTTRGAAEFIYQTLRAELEERGLSFAMVRDTRPDETDWREGIESMHLDTFSNPIGYQELAVCQDEASTREVIVLSTDSSGDLVADNRGGFIDHLTEEGNSLLLIPKAEQKDFACNFLAIDGHTILLPGRENESLMKGLQERGKRVIIVDLFENTRGYGASHCMTGQLARASLRI